MMDGTRTGTDVIWHASSLASGTGVEVAYDGEHVLFRYSSKPDVILRFTTDEWYCFVEGVKLHEFDDFSERARQGKW